MTCLFVSTEKRLCWQVVSETYEELVFNEPTESFYQRVANHMPMLAPPMSQAQWFTTFNQQEDLRKVNAARQRVAGMTASVQRQLGHEFHDEGLNNLKINE